MKKMIDLSLILTLNPCQDRLANYTKHYGNRTFTKQQFMGLRNITHDDKVWVAVRLLSKDNIKLAAADIAESVLHIYEKQYPNDNRPRKAIEAARSNDKEMAIVTADAANVAAYYAATNAARCAAYAAVRAANYAAYAYTDADAAYAVADAAYYAYYAAYYAYYAAYYTATDKQKREKLIRKILLRYWK